MRTVGVVVTLLALLLVLSSCSVKLGNPPEEKPSTPAATEPTTPAAGGSGAKVVTLVAGDQRDEESREITNTTTTFTTATQAIFVNAAIKGLQKDAKITGTLMAVDVVTASGAKVRDTEVASTDVTSPGDEATVNLNFTPPTKGWPTGKYVVNILVEGQQIDSLDLTIEKTGG
jgi:hypothetical protein